MKHPRLQCQYLHTEAWGQGYQYVYQSQVRYADWYEYNFPDQTWKASAHPGQWSHGQVCTWTWKSTLDLCSSVCFLMQLSYRVSVYQSCTTRNILGFSAWVVAKQLLMFSNGWVKCAQLRFCGHALVGQASLCNWWVPLLAQTKG